MDRLAVSLVPRSSDLGVWIDVRLSINGSDLIELATTFERERGWEPVGGYDWLPVDGLRPARDRLLALTSEWTGDERTVLLVCDGCREEGCWPLVGRVTMTKDQVEWRDFQQPHRPDRDYSDLRFSFGRFAYEAEVERAFANLSKRG